MYFMLGFCATAAAVCAFAAGYSARAARQLKDAALELIGENQGLAANNGQIRYHLELAYRAVAGGDRAVALGHVRDAITEVEKVT